MTDVVGNSASYTYDSANRRISETDAMLFNRGSKIAMNDGTGQIGMTTIQRQVTISSGTITLGNLIISK